MSLPLKYRGWKFPLKNRVHEIRTRGFALCRPRHPRPPQHPRHNRLRGQTRKPLRNIKKNGGYSLAQVDAAPRAMNQTLPRYPRRARQRNIEGWVKVRFLVDKEGRVRNLRILKESPSGVFHKTVMETAPRWRFSPATKEGTSRERLGGTNH